MGREIFEWIMTIVAALVITTVVKAFIFELVRVEGSSMKSTLADQEIMLVTKYEYSSTWLTMPFDLQNDNAEEMATRFAIGTPKRLDIVICVPDVRAAGYRGGIPGTEPDHRQAHRDPLRQYARRHRPGA